MIPEEEATDSLHYDTSMEMIVHTLAPFEIERTPSADAATCHLNMNLAGRSFTEAVQLSGDLNVMHELNLCLPFDSFSMALCWCSPVWIRYTASFTWKGNLS